MVKPKDKVFKDTSGDSLIFKTRDCRKLFTEKRVTVLDITWTCDNDDTIEFESPAKIRQMAKSMVSYARWIEKQKK